MEKRRRAKDGLPLKSRTRAEYLAMIEPGKTSLSGKKFADGELYTIAGKLISKVTGDDIRFICSAVLKRSQRQATHAMQVLRAVFR